MTPFEKLPKRLQDYINQFRKENLNSLDGLVTNTSLKDYSKEEIQKLVMYAIVNDLTELKG